MNGNDVMVALAFVVLAVWISTLRYMAQVHKFNLEYRRREDDHKDAANVTNIEDSRL